MKEIKQGIFRAYDIRGVVDKDLDEEWVETLGRACAAYFRGLGLNRAVVGHDCRHSSPAYQDAVIKGLASSGMDVVALNLVSTPEFYFACKHLGYEAGVMITASHNPPEFNGFKVWAGESTIHSEEIRKIYEIMSAGDFVSGEGVVTEHDIRPAYVEELVSQLELKAPVKVVVDGGNGAGGEVTADILKKCGAEVIELYTEPDGSFPNHHPDPIVEKYMTDLIAKVKETGAKAGIGLDGDGDRIGVIDENGNMLYGDQLLAVYARDMLQERPGATVIAEVKCSHLMYQDIEKHGGNPIMWKTGHSLIKAKMKETDAELAGEMSGHMFFADRYYGFDDATYAALRFVEIMSKKPDVPVSQYLADWPETYNTPEIRKDCPDEAKFDVVERAQEHFRKEYDIIDVDGVRITFEDGWGLVRASNTQPVLVLRFEAESEERLAEIREIIEGPLDDWIEEMS
jgi:phosphomannomutase/phosphoglucomutase